MKRSPRRGRDIHEQNRTATPLELLFDLTFVVAIALAAAQLHHGLAEHHTFAAYARFVGVFFGIWWAWMNYTWYASAYDNDDVTFRLLTMVQMVGVLVLAVGVPGIVDGQWTGVVAGYVLMRLALVVQWLLAAHGDLPRRRTCLRYAIGISIMQVLWVAWLWVPAAWGWTGFAVLVVGELLVPVWAERAERTPWHPHHIAERYGLLVIITPPKIHVWRSIMTRILGISGSLRAGSYNTALLREMQAQAGKDVQFDMATLHGIPLYDGDLEAREGIPEAVDALKNRIVASDGVILATPEYNNSVPGVFKNAIDWLSRPPDDIPRVFGGCPFTLVGASIGGFGTILSQDAWLSVLRHLRARVWFGDRVLVSRAGKAFDEQGKLIDEDLRKQLAKFVAGFARFVA